MHEKVSDFLSVLLNIYSEEVNEMCQLSVPRPVTNYMCHYLSHFHLNLFVCCVCIINSVFGRIKIHIHAQFRGNLTDFCRYVQTVVTHATFHCKAAFTHTNNSAFQQILCKVYKNGNQLGKDIGENSRRS